MSNPVTIAELKSNVFEKFDRKNPRIEALFDSQVETWLQELSREHPWFFMRHYPIGISELPFPLNLATAVRKKDQFIAPGWLITEPDQGRYPLVGPNEHEQWPTPAWWVDMFANRIWFVKRFDEKGVFMDDLEVISRDRAFSLANQSTPGLPDYVYLTTTEEGSYLNFVRIPDKQYLFAVEFQQIRQQNYAVVLSSYNKFLTNAARAAELYCLIQVGHYFNEPSMIERFERELYGSPPKGLHLAINQKTGLLGSLVNDTQKAIKQHNTTLHWFRSAKLAVGRHGSANYRRGRNNRWGYY